VDFSLTDVQLAWRNKGASLGREVAGDAAAAGVVQGASRAGLLDPAADLLAIAIAVDAMANESPAAAVTFALHSGTALAVAGDERFSSLFRGEAVAAVGLSSDDMPVEEGGRLSGRAPWVAPITDRGVAIVAPRSGGARTAYAVSLGTPGVSVAIVHTAALEGLVCGHLTLQGVTCTPIGATLPIMTRIRVLMAAAGLGIGRRALREALATARAAHTAAAGEQTVQGLLADAATDLDAAMMMVWKAAASPMPSLADASMAKLAATGAAQRAVERATQVVGADSFQRGHIVERLAQDVRALELFAGRTEALREAVAEGVLPHRGSGSS
jgi:alkylation response protein AidB-like acyl-CoA dehydrogenase